VKFFGGVKDVRPFYGAADVFALPTLYDPFPNAALEAWACGLPVVTSTDCGAAELVVEGENGYVCHARDVPGLCQKLGLALSRAAHMADAARTSVSQLSMEAMGARLQALYRHLLAARSAPL
jgi:UDP-glucose:(heptosyl)LPS alpha-1,3-glucosyltransferase